MNVNRWVLPNINTTWTTATSTTWTGPHFVHDSDAEFWSVINSFTHDYTNVIWSSGTHWMGASTKIGGGQWYASPITYTGISIGSGYIATYNLTSTPAAMNYTINYNEI